MASSVVPKGDVTEDGCRFRGLDVDTDEEDDKINTDNREEAIKEACTDIKCSDESCVSGSIKKANSRSSSTNNRSTRTVTGDNYTK